MQPASAELQRDSLSSGRFSANGAHGAQQQQGAPFTVALLGALEPGVAVRRLLSTPAVEEVDGRSTHLK